ncbi:adenylate/guanylate cyclase domain-containing protein [Aromatoleum evansii]|uniref:Adenylate/guanylate cyclase domain-containing protein n=1 Tax=Aromatoleum evansii TaxID=59406 RepID=A0ABZ1AKZ3_AROEV|nr:adenylate/guanylate cyclase domain-containing protein [Aromatoleum evansii]
MTEPNNVCVLVVQIPGADRIAEALEPTEARRALERCMHRIDLAIEAHGGTAERRADAGVCASFRHGDAAVLAICEMFDRVQSLPPLRGLRMTISIGLHCGTGAEDAERGATRLAETAKPGHALASEAVVTQLSATGRQFVATSPSRNPALAGLGWTAFAVARQPAAASTPVDKPPEPRVRIRHGQDTLFVDHARPVVLLGRELGNDIVIADPRASRQHARIERRRDGFVLIDQSTNGTFLADDSGKESCIKGAELVLTGSGRIGCGFSANEVERELVFVDIV